jgi:outer membrane autotransporter protein
VVTFEGGDGGVALNMTGGSIGTAAQPLNGMGVFASATGNGAIDLTVRNVFAAGLGAAVAVNTPSNGAINLHVAGPISSANRSAVDVVTTGTGSITIDGAGSITGSVRVIQNYAGAAPVTGNITITGSSAINANNIFSLGMVDAEILGANNNGAILIDRSGPTTFTLNTNAAAIAASTQGAGAITVNISDNVTAVQQAITAFATSGAVTVNINGGTTTGGISVSNTAGTSTLNVTGGDVHGDVFANRLNISAGRTVIGTVQATDINNLGTIDGSVRVFGGTLAVGNGGTTGTLLGDVQLFLANSTLRFNRSDTATYGGSITTVISNDTLVDQAGTGVTVFTKTGSSYFGQLAVSAGTLRAGAVDVFGPSAVTVGGGILDLNGFNQTIGSLSGTGTVTLGSATLTVSGINTSTAFSGTISGSGGLTMNAPGSTLTLSGTNGYSGATTVTTGTLQAGAVNAFGTNSAVSVGSFATLDLNGFNQTAGSLAGLSGGAVKLGSASLTAGGDNSSTTFAGTISGGGGLIKDGTGTMILTGNNSYFGTTTISGGVLQLGNGGTKGSVLGAIVDNATLAYNRSDNTTLSNPISGTGAVRFDGSSTTTLAANFGYTGATTVNAGTLKVTGSIASSSLTTVNNGATLTGTGTVGSTTVNGGLAPGVSIGTLSVNGNLTFNAGSTYAVEATPTSGDKTVATGALTINGGSVQVAAANGNYGFGRTSIINAASVTGTFSSFGITGSLGNLVRNPHLAYDANNVYLTLDPNLFTALLPPGSSGNVQNVAAGIDNAILHGAAQPPGLLPLYNLTGPALTNALTQLTGQQAAGAAQAGFQTMGSFLSLMLNPFTDTRGGGFGAAQGYAPEQQVNSLPPEVANAYAAAMPVKAAPLDPFGGRWSMWGSAFGGQGRVDGNVATGSNDTTARVYGFATGMDYRVTASTLIGFSLGGGGTGWSVSGLGNGHSDFFQAGLYGSQRWGNAYVSAALAYGWHQASTKRTVAVGTVETETADFNAHGYGARLETGYRFATPWLGVTPYGAIQVQSFRTPSYREVTTFGPGAFALSYNAETTTTARTELGVWLDRPIVLPNKALLTLWARGAWAHDTNNERPLTALFQSLPASTFTVNGATPAKDGGLATAAADYRISSHLSVLAKFDGEFSRTTTIYAGTGTVRYVW